MTLHLPAVELEHLRAAPLKLALTQVRFNAILAVEQAPNAAEFHNHLGTTYEFLGRQVTQNIRVYMGEAEIEQGVQQLPETIWRFRHTERDWTVSLSSTSLGFEATIYYDFDDFAAEFERVLEAFSEVFSVRRLMRYGMRYINEIADPRLEDQAQSFSYFLNPLLVQPVEALNAKVISSLSDYRFAQPDGTLVLRHGLVAPQTYLLDFDYFREAETDFDHGMIMTLTNDYHMMIERLFVWCLSEDYLAELRKGDENDSSSGS